MEELFGPDFITVTDEDGNEFELEHLDTLEHEGETYMAFSPAAPLDDGSGRPAERPPAACPLRFSRPCRRSRGRRLSCAQPSALSPRGRA